MTLRLPALLTVPVLLAALTACAHGSMPTSSRYFQPTPDQIGPEFNTYGEAVLPEHGLIVVQGDDLAYGVGLHPTNNRINDADVGQASLTISENLRHVLGAKRVRVENRGFPGDTVADSAERWADMGPGDLLILAYGFGDMKAHTSSTDFLNGLRAMVRKAHARGAAVFIVTAPQLADKFQDAKLNTYRDLANAIGEQEGAEVFSSIAAMTTAKETPAKGVPQKAKTYEVIAASMIPYIKLVTPQS
jgi:lysophospholipase L1-like esterase